MMLSLVDKPLPKHGPRALAKSPYSQLQASAIDMANIQHGLHEAAANNNKHSKELVAKQAQKNPTGKDPLTLKGTNAVTPTDTATGEKQGHISSPPKDAHMVEGEASLDTNHQQQYNKDINNTSNKGKV
eukprot:4333062-Ditylum_brightwellii.AAC.1